MKYLILGYVFLGSLFFCCTGCDKDVATPTGTSIASITSGEAVSVAQNSATITTSIINNTSNAPSITTRGICWDSLPAPTVASSSFASGSGTGSYSLSITNLRAGKQYYARGFFKILEHYYYGNEVTFTTLGPTPATIGIISTASLTRASVVINCSITLAGGSPVVARGVCWSSTATTPTVPTNSYLQNGNGIGTYAVSVAGLTAATTYYMRAYALTDAGYSYSNAVTVKTLN